MEIAYHKVEFDTRTCECTGHTGTILRDQLSYSDPQIRVEWNGRFDSDGMNASIQRVWREYCEDGSRKQLALAQKRYEIERLMYAHNKRNTIINYQPINLLRKCGVCGLNVPAIGSGIDGHWRQCQRDQCGMWTHIGCGDCGCYVCPLCDGEYENCDVNFKRLLISPWLCPILVKLFHRLF
eukprot:57024_1